MANEDVRTSAQDDVVGAFDPKPPPQFGQFQHEGLRPRPNQGGPAVLVRNTFLDIDDRPPTPPALARARTTPPGYPAAGALAQDLQENSGCPPHAMYGPLLLTGNVLCRHASRDGPLQHVPKGPGFGRADGMPPSAVSTPRSAMGSMAQPMFFNGRSNSQGDPSDANASPRAPVTEGSGCAEPSVQRSGPPAAPTQSQPQLRAAVPSLLSEGQRPQPPQAPLTPLRPQRPHPPSQHTQDTIPQPTPHLQSQPSPQPQPSQQPFQPLQPRQPQQTGSGLLRPRQADSIQVEPPVEVFTSDGGACGSQDDAVGSSAGPPPQPQTLTRHYSTNSGYFRVHWTVDARKLRGNDKQAVSPPFELSFGNQFPNVTFKLMLYPKVVNDAKGGASFKKARGRGYVQLKCEAELSEAIANVSFRVSIGSGVSMQEPRGPVSHNFSSSAVCGLPKEQEEWDFSNVVDQESMTFVVCLEIVPASLRVAHSG